MKVVAVEMYMLALVYKICVVMLDLYFLLRQRVVQHVAYMVEIVVSQASL